MQRKKGFTLVELLVALVCAALVLSMITAAVIFLTKMNDGATNESKTLFQLQTVKDFVQKNTSKDLGDFGVLDFNYKVEDGKVLHRTVVADESGNPQIREEQVVVSNSLIEDITFSSKEGTVSGNTVKIFTCTITYDGGQTFEFVAYTKTTPTTPTETDPTPQP